MGVISQTDFFKFSNSREADEQNLDECARKCTGKKQNQKALPPCLLEYRMKGFH